MNFNSGGWTARWGSKNPKLPVNPYDGGSAFNDIFPFTSNIDCGSAFSMFPVFIIDCGIA